MKRKATQVIDYAKQPPQLRCTGCQGTAPFSLPMRVSQVTAVVGAFRKEHWDCDITEEVAAPAAG